MYYEQPKPTQRFLTITIGTKYLSVESNVRGVHSALNNVNFKLVEWESKYDYKTKKRTSTPKSKYYWISKDGTKAHYHIAFKDLVIERLKASFFWDIANIVHLTPDYGVDVDIPLNTEFSPRGNQPEWIEFLTQDTPTRILPASTGGGKTACGLYSSSIIGKRTNIYVEPKYFDLWLTAIEKFLVIDMDEDIALISGEKGHSSIAEIIERGQANDLTEKFNIISLNAMQNYITSFEDGGYGCRPEEFHRVLGTGFKIEDEAHQWLNFRVISDAFNNLPRNVYLTATLMKEMPFQKKMENAVYPKEDRCPVPPPKKHVNMVAVSYQFNPKWKLPSVRGPFGYSHNKLEKFFKHKSFRREALFQLIGITIDREFIQPYLGRYRALIYFSTKEMVYLFKKYINKHYPEVNAQEYIGGSDKDTIRTADLIISTPKKSGTGTDIPNLVATFQSISVAAKGENFQNVGRIRELSPDANGHTPDEKFIYFYSKSLEKHVQYHRKRKVDFNSPESIVKTFKEHDYHTYI